MKRERDSERVAKEKRRLRRMPIDFLEGMVEFFKRRDPRTLSRDEVRIFSFVSKRVVSELMEGMNEKRAVELQKPFEGKRFWELDIYSQHLDSELTSFLLRKRFDKCRKKDGSLDVKKLFPQLAA